MAKRKAGVNNIIYELDNEDLTASSDDEGKESKIICTEHNNFSKDIKNSLNTSDIVIEITDVKLSDDTNYENLNNDVLNNGGKIDADIVTKEIDSKKITNECESKVNGSLDDRNKSTEICKTIIFNEDIDIDSPASNSDLGVVGCENRTPLVSVRFKDNKLAKNYKKKVKEFMLNLIKLHETDLFTADSDTDVEFDIWPEDLSEEELEEPSLPPPEVDNLFFVDTDPKNVNIDIPMYEQASLLISNTTEGETSSPQVLRRGPTCFNCDGAHPLRECTLPRNNARIAENRRYIGVKLGRYHVEDDQKYGHLIPGRISGQLRHALGLKRNEIPMHIYKMRMLGYPPGWLEEARISHSGITMFDSTGRAIMDPEEEEGEVSEPGCKDKFDIKKILDFPGFNVPASSRYKEESHLYGFPPMSEQDSKMVMLQMLAPNAMKAYKRKKLTFFPSSNNNSLQEGQAEMELDSGDENPAFPSVPPLPDDEPPPVPPPPSSPPPESPKPKLITNIQNEDKENESDKSQSDIEVIEVIQVTDIPVPEDELITIDDDDEVSMVSSGRNSPTIDDLEAKKRQLLDAIKFTETATDSGTDTDLKEVDILEDISEIESTEAITSPIPKVTDTIEELNNDDIKNVNDTDVSSEDVKPSTSPPPVIENVPPSDSEVTKTPDMKTGIVKNTQYGTPVINSLSPYVKVPTDDKFAKDICDVIQFENLPNSIGKYKKISSLLKKVKGEVERIQDS